MKDRELNPVLKYLLLASLPLAVLIFSFVPLPETLFILLILALLSLWVYHFYYEGFYSWADIPLALLVLGTFIFGRTFSVIGIQAGPLPLYITEVLIAFSLVLLFFKEKSIARLWNQWHAPVPKDLMAAIAVYFLMGTLYIILGFKSNGTLALRDITICNYMILLVITLSLMDRVRLTHTLSRFFVPGMFVLFMYGLISFFVRVPGSSAFRQLIKSNKNTPLALSLGLFIIFGLAFYEYIIKKTAKPFHKKAMLIGIQVMAFILLVMSETRAAWVGLFVALLLVTLFLKKEMKVILLILVFLAASIWLIYYFDLTLKKDKLTHLKNEVTSMAKPRIENMAGANIKFRLGIWKETLVKIMEKPILGWGFGVQIDYLIWGKRLSEIAAKGGSTGILPAHNHVLAIWHKLGIVGLLLFLFINARIFFLGFFYVNKCTCEFKRRLLVSGLGSLLLWHGMAFFFDILESPPTGIFLWIILGLIVGTVYLDKQKQDI